jgi:DNA-binding transcriptional LysR family regulator
MANISNLDLNLLLVLHTVLEEGSATRAARRLHVTQSAVSNTLARLRDIFEDELVVRDGHGLTPTPRALELRPRLDALVREARAVLEPPARFDPLTSTREFSLACADYYSTIVVPALVARLHQRAPHVTLRVRTLDDLVADHGLERDTDLHIGMPPKIPSGCQSSVLFQDRFVVLSRRTRAKQPLTLERFVVARHVRVSLLGRARDPIDLLLAERGLERSIGLIVPYFSAVPFVVHETGLLATMSLRLAAVYARRLPIDIGDPPIELPQYGVRMVWHRRTNADAAAKFFREVVRELISEGLP